MADFKELIISDEFRPYRKRQVTVVVEFIHNDLRSGLSGDSNTDRMRGALDMANRLLRLPGELVNDDKLAENLDKMVQEDLVSISAYLVRSYINHE